jgi:hypothetical protein
MCPLVHLALMALAVCTVHAIVRKRSAKSRAVKSILGMKVWFKKSLNDDSASEDDDSDADKPRDEVRGAELSSDACGSLLK